MKYVQLVVAISLLALLSACGGFRKEATGLEEQTAILIMSEELVGARVFVAGQSWVITKSDLRDYEVGVLGVKDSQDERLDTYVVKLDQGTHNIKVVLPNGAAVSKEMYLSTGQIRKWVIQ